MKRTDAFTSFIFFLLFAAAGLYVIACAVRTLGHSTVTAQVCVGAVKCGGTVSGIAVREESLLLCAVPYCFVTARDGAKVAAGGALAIAGESETAVAAEARILTLEARLAQLDSAIALSKNVESPVVRSHAAQSAAAALTAAVAGRAVSDRDNALLRLHSLLFSSSDAESERSEIEAALTALRSSQDTAAPVRVLTAPESGIFSAAADGCESLSPAALDALTPEKLDALCPETRAPLPDGVYGKLVRGFRWYYAAALAEADAADLRPGQTVTLRFSAVGEISAELQSCSEAVQGRVAVVFRCETGLSEALSLRETDAELITETRTGLSVPPEALHTDPDTGEEYVWTITARRLERKTVCVLHRDSERILVAAENRADALREGNTLVVSGRKLYEGKIMG